VTINVARSEDEAARQARGEAVTGRAMDDAAEEAEAARRAAEALFEEGAKPSEEEEQGSEEGEFASEAEPA
jgi:large subunit ribosomal protein L9